LTFKRIGGEQTEGIDDVPTDMRAGLHELRVFLILPGGQNLRSVHVDEEWCYEYTEKADADRRQEVVSGKGEL
jgi:hypothetical protein